MDLQQAQTSPLVLVDGEPGCRHAKRYQDVEELLNAGIDVYTTVNVQHLESLNDIVYQITPHATAGDRPGHQVLQGADEIELIDLPEELIDCMKARFTSKGSSVLHRTLFRPGNLRHTFCAKFPCDLVADSVDKRMLHYMEAHAIAGLWPVHQRSGGYLRQPYGRWCTRFPR